MQPGEEPIENKFVKGHSVLEWSAPQWIAKHAGGEHNIGLALQDGGGDRGQNAGVVLVIGMEHHHDPGAVVEGKFVTRLLVPTVPSIPRMLQHGDSHFPGERGGLIVAGVIDQNDPVESVAGHVPIGSGESFGGVVGGHNDHDSRPRIRFNHSPHFLEPCRPAMGTGTVPPCRFRSVPDRRPTSTC